MSEDPKPTHDFVSGDGTKREHFWVPHDPPEYCDTCNEYGDYDDRIMGVISDVEDTISLECLHCGADKHVRSADFKFKHKPPTDYDIRRAKANVK